jgi:hypothetical protein
MYQKISHMRVFAQDTKKQLETVEGGDNVARAC